MVVHAWKYSVKVDSTIISVKVHLILFNVKNLRV